MTLDTAHFQLERRFDISVDQLWHLLTDPHMRERWGAPEPGMVMTAVKEDLRVGGLEQHVAGDPANPDFEAATRWYRLDGPSDAVYTETISAQGTTFATSMITYRVAPEGSGSALAVDVLVSSFTGPETLNDFQKGWEGGLSNLQALAEERATV